MGKKKARQKKMAEEAKKALVVTPQLVVTLQGKSPEQWLSIELPNGSGSRHKIKLEPETAYSTLMIALQEKAGEIELERQLLQDRINKQPRQRRQPDWQTIAIHPQAEIRQGLIEASLTAKGSVSICPTKGRALASNKAEKSLEEMGL